MNYTSNDTAILLTAYVGGNDPEHYSCGDEQTINMKKHMTKTITKYLQKSGYYICLSTHSIIDEETQRMCNAFVYDSDNRWQINGQPSTPSHAVAEMTIMHNGVDFLHKKGFKNFFKIAYDHYPDLNYEKIITKFTNLNKKVVTYKDYYGIGTGCYMSDIDFFRQTLSLNEIHRCDQPLERVWLSSIREHKLEHEIYGYSSYKDMLEFPENTPDHYASCTLGGVLIAEGYKF